MKKLVTVALLAFAAIPMWSQKATVDQAKKLAGKLDRIEEARSLIQEAFQNPETADKAETYYVAGKIEWDAYDKNKASQAINPDKVDPLQMGEQLVNGYNYFVQVFPRDNEPNEKGEIKQKYTKELQGKISGKLDDFYLSGALLLNDRDHYPTAYKAFMIYGDMPELEVLGNKKPVIKDTLKSRAWAYYYAGRAAFGANNLEDAIVAFRKARQQNFRSYDENTPNAHLFEIACWQSLDKSTPEKEAEAHANILEIAKEGFSIYGASQPIFLTNIADGLNYQNKADEALVIVNQAIEDNPNVPEFYSVRAWLNDNLGNDDASVADYLTAVNFPNVTYDVMRAAIHKLLFTGQKKLNEIELGDPEIKQKKSAVKNEYIVKAQQLIDKAAEMTDNPSDLDYFKESAEYLMGI